jgi:glyoxylase-like metal-dependent hydrolase (beta-lactamase superfamily II)
VLTGDTLFSGGVGRPDLLGLGLEGRLAEQLHDSLCNKLLTLPDHVEVYPAHFSGAACGKGLSGKATSTIGFERRFSPPLQRLASKTDFVRFVLEGLPPQPPQFADNRRRNLGEE